MDQWNHPNHQNHQNLQSHPNHLNQNQAGTIITANSPMSHSHMGHVPKEEVQYIMRQVTDSVRFAMCEAIRQRSLLWDSSREKCSSAARKRLFGEVVDVINSQFVLNPPISMEEVEKHWKNLKDTYVKTRRKLTYDREGCLNRPKWKFFDALLFLDTANHHNSEYIMKKRSLSMPFPSSSFEAYHGIPSKKEKLEETPTDEFMEFCRSLYLPLKEIGLKDKVQWLTLQKTIRDIIYNAQLENIKGPPNM
ncbi:hypothetical protein L5515_001516 [Caenorhabditis briggsae]|nr:hypothetical protein L5515_001516 [Caenorhabditis briggsae]